MEYVREPVAWTKYEVSDDGRFLRLFFIQAGTAKGPSYQIASVRRQGTVTGVAVTLAERALRGTFPDGSHAATPQMAVPSCLVVPLRRPLGTRAVYDGSRRKRARQVREPSPYLDGRVAEDGCPRWVF